MSESQKGIPRRGVSGREEGIVGSLREGMKSYISLFEQGHPVWPELASVP